MIKNYTTTEYSIEELNLYVNDIARTDLSSCKKSSILRQMFRKYKNAQGVYKITNVKNNKIYIGSTLDDEGFLRRFKRHHSTLLKREHFNIHLQRSFNKYGEDAFVYEVIEFYYQDINLDKKGNKEALEKREQYYMDLYQVRDVTKGYNEADHAHGGFNWLTWETLEKRSKITKDQLTQILKYLTDTDIVCSEIDEIVNVKKGTSSKIYNRKIFNKITEDYIFKFRDNSVFGEKSVNAVLTEEEVLDIMEKLKIGVNIPDIAKEYRVDRAVIHDIKNKRTWSYLSKDMVFFDYPKIKKDSELPPVYQYSLDGSLKKEWMNAREASRSIGEISAIATAIQQNSLYYHNYFWSYEKMDKYVPKAPIQLFFYYWINGEEKAFFEINRGKPCDCCSMVKVPIALYDHVTKSYLWAWRTKTELSKKIDEKRKNIFFWEHRLFQNRYEIIPMREVDEEGLKEIKDLLEHGEEMDYSILGYNTSNKADYFPIKSENEQYKRMFVETAVLSYKK